MMIGATLIFSPTVKAVFSTLGETAFYFAQK